MPISSRELFRIVDHSEKQRIKMIRELSGEAHYEHKVNPKVDANGHTKVGSRTSAPSINKDHIVRQPHINKIGKFEKPKKLQSKKSQKKK